MDLTVRFIPEAISSQQLRDSAMAAARLLQEEIFGVSIYRIEKRRYMMVYDVIFYRYDGR